MTKLLKIRFVKFEKALATQVLEQEGKFEKTEHIRIRAYPATDESCIFLRGWEVNSNFKVITIHFETNTERDEYLDKVVKWISEEQFATSGKLEVGKMCEVSNDGRCWARRILLAILPKGFNERYICQSNLVDIGWIGCEYARPITSIQPTIDEDNNEIYTWEMEIEDEE